MKYLDENGLLYFWQKLKGKFVAKETGKGLSTNDFTTALKNKLDGIATGAEVNQNAFSKVVGGNTTVEADTKTDTLTLTAGSNVQISGNASTDTITISATDTTYSDVTTTAHGLMTAADKVKLNGIAEGATANVGTITGVSMNGTSVATSGVANIISLPASILSGAIPSAVTATTQSAGNNSTKIATTAFVKTAIDNAVTGAMTYKGSVATYGDLPKTGNKTGDIWNVTDTGKNYAWDGTGWDDFGDFVDLTNYVQFDDLVAITNAEIDTIVAS